MTLWLKSLKYPDGTPKYSVELINTIPTAIQAIIAVTTFLAGSLAGIWSPFAMLAFVQGINLVAVVVLRIWTVADGLKWAGYFLLGLMGAPNPLFFGWINRITKRNAEERAVVMGSVFCFGWAFFAVSPLSSRGSNTIKHRTDKPWSAFFFPVGPFGGVQDDRGPSMDQGVLDRDCVYDHLDGDLLPRRVSPQEGRGEEGEIGAG